MELGALIPIIFVRLAVIIHEFTYDWSSSNASIARFRDGGDYFNHRFPIIKVSPLTTDWKQSTSANLLFGEVFGRCLETWLDLAVLD